MWSLLKILGFSVESVLFLGGFFVFVFLILRDTYVTLGRGHISFTSGYEEAQSQIHRPHLTSRKTL